MNIDSFEDKSLSVVNDSFTDKLGELNKYFKPSVDSTDGLFKNTEFSIPKTDLHEWIDIKDITNCEIQVDSVVNNIKQMYYGDEMTLPNDAKVKTMGIEEVGKWKGDITEKSILRSRAGYDAEIISTAKENIINDALGNGKKTYRADDRPDLFPRNDQYVDKIRVDSNGNIIERIQTKFIGDDGRTCYKKLMNNRDFDKYFTDGKVDKIEIPKDYYNDVKDCIAVERADLETQIERLNADGKTEIAEHKQARLDKVNQLDSMLEQSNTTSTEAIQAAKHPKLYAAKQMMPSIVKKGAMDGLEQAKTAIIVTGAISTVDNMSRYIDGEIGAEEAVKNIAVDTGTAGAASFGLGFVTSTTASMMRSSSNKFIRSVGSAGGGCIPAVAVSYGIEVHETVIDYAKGNIDNTEFIDQLGRSGAKVAGGMVGGSLGSFAGPVGSYAGAAVGSKVGEFTYDATKYAVNTAIDLADGETTLEEVSEELKDAAIDKYEEIKETTSETVEKYKDLADHVAEETGLDEKITEVKDDIEKTIEDASEKVDETVEKVKDYQQSAKELLSSTVNYTITSEAYVTAVDACEGAIESNTENLSRLENKAKEYADKAIEKAGDFGADAVSDVKAAISDFNIKNSLPFKI